MTHDAVVVGAGLAGLCAALRLAEAGRRVLVVARGVGGLPLSPGTIDVLGYAPDRVDSPQEALPGFVAAHPGHPYGRLSGALAPALEWFRDRVAGLGYAGGLERNLLLPTALGVARPTSLAPRTMAAGALAGAAGSRSPACAPSRTSTPRSSPTTSPAPTSPATRRSRRGR